MNNIYAPETEQAILAYVLRKPNELTNLRDMVKPEDFGWRAYGWVWEAMGSLQDREMGIDTITVGDELERMGKLSEFCPPGSKSYYGRAALSYIREMPLTNSGESYAITIQDYSAKRKIMNWMSNAANWANEGRRSADIISDLEKSFSTLNLQEGKSHIHTSPTEISGIRAIEASRMASNGARAFPTGLIDLDKLIAIQKQELVTFAARPGIGKSALLGTISLNAARQGKHILFFSVEMSIIQMTQRFLSLISGVPAFRIMQGKLTSDEWDKVETANEEWSDLNLTICDLSAIRIGQVRLEARRGHYDAIVLDYVQLAKSDTKNDRRDLDIGEVTMGMKSLAKELDVPAIMAAQLSRLVEGRADKRPTLSDLRESGSIENDSDTVGLLYQKSEIDPTEIIIAKHRNGPVGSIFTYFERETMKFLDCTMSSVSLKG